MKKGVIVLLLLLVAGCNYTPTKSENVGDEFYEFGLISLEIADLRLDSRIHEVGPLVRTRYELLPHIQNNLLPHATEEEQEIYSLFLEIATCGIMSDKDCLLRARNDLAVLLGRQQR